MRLHLTTSSTVETLSFNYQNLLTGVLHKWIGKNNLHDETSMYCFSWLKGGVVKSKGIEIPERGYFFIGAHNPELIQKIVEGIRKSPSITHGLEVKEIVIQEDPEFGNSRIFHPGSPIFIKRRVENRDIHYTWEDEKANALLTETLQNKLRKAGLDEQGVKVEFDPDYRNRKIKTIYYNNIGNKVNMSAVKITGTPEQLVFAWNVGVGNSTGIGFGALK